MSRLACRVALLFAFTGCARMTLAPRIVIDRDFTDSEIEMLHEAVDAWRDVVPEVGPASVTIMAHSHLEEFARQAHLQDDEILILASRDCPGYGEMPGMGITHVENGGNRSAIICVDVEQARRAGNDAHRAYLADPTHRVDWTSDDMFRGTFAHEIGHAWDLEHDNSTVRLMNTELHAWLTTVPNCDDARALARTWGVETVERCR